ncbi:hypothetical protein ACKWTF_002782 [Chironomus riparius]
MGRLKPLSYRIVQIFIAILIPNVGGLMMFLLLTDKIKEHDGKDRIEPFYAPPDWFVGVAWITLYTLMGISSWRLWMNKKSHDIKIPLLIYFIKLLLNWLWPLLAFGLDLLLGAIIEMIVLLIFVVVTGALFYKVDKLSGILFIPYFAYLTYATILCIHIYILNN